MQRLKNRLLSCISASKHEEPSLPEPEIPPLLTLPQVPFHLIIQELSPIDIVHLSFISHQLRPMIQNARMKLESFECRLWPGNVCFDLKLKSKEFKIRFPKVSRHSRNVENQIPVKINGLEFKIGSFERLMEISEDPVNSQGNPNDVWILFNYICGLFSMKNLVLDMKNVLVSVYSQLQLDRPFKSLDMKNANPCMGDEFQNFTDLLNTVKVDNLYVSRHFYINCEYYTGFKQPNVTISHASWLRIDAVLNMECETFAASDTPISPQEINMFIKKWMEGGFEKLEQVRLERNIYAWKGVGSYGYSGILEGVDSTASQSKLTKGRVVQRACDGKKATVHANGSLFLFVVHL